MNRFSSEKDRTAQQPARGAGAVPARMCSRCNKPRLQLGGRLDKRTRMWVCVGCIGA